MIPAARQCSFWSSDGVLGNRPVPPPALPISPVNARRAAPGPTSFRVGRRYGRSADPGTPAAKIAIAFLLALLWTIAPRCTLSVDAAGSGKTVLLKTAMGLTKPESGKVFGFGQDISTMSEKHLFDVRSKIGMLFQESALFDSLNIDRKSVVWRNKGESG